MRQSMLFLLIGVVFLSSCKKDPDYLLNDLAEIQDLTPISIAWYRFGKEGWELNKTWAGEETLDIIELLKKCEIILPYNHEYKLSILFYDGHPENFRLFETYFDIRAKAFYCNFGISKELGEILYPDEPERPTIEIPSRKSH